MCKYANAVAKGAKYLDTVSPGWFLKSELDTLDSVRGNKCIADLALGEDGWHRAWCELPSTTHHYGFNASEPNDKYVVEAWHTLIAEKRAQHAHFA